VIVAAWPHHRESPGGRTAPGAVSLLTPAETRLDLDTLLP